MLQIIEREHPIEAIEAALRERLERKLCAALGVPYIAGATVGAWTVFGSFIEKVGNKLIDLDTDTFKALLVTSSWTPNTSTDDELADVSGNQAANSVTVTITTPTWTRSGATTTFDADDITFSASGGNAVARYCVIYDDTPAGDPLVCYCLLDTAPANVTILSGDSLIIQLNASGILSAA
ncbi:MAG: hypothetical protein IT301_05255 [Dehalococcoidia bacterium]|nr:hypothetical protein [Dehalococcoidia bacterium]